MRFVDTNVLLYAVSSLPEDAGKRDRARELLRSRDWRYRCSSRTTTACA